ncbi:MAG: cation:proton antiporter [Firmicutes bacterium]|nr:cation:proton antiporter [Bacillota bacterium]
MHDLLTASILCALILIAGVISIELALSAAIIEIIFGIAAGSLFGVQSTSWLSFIASLGGILLTFLAGTEVDVKVMKEKFKESLLIGGLSFLVPFLLVFLYTYFIAGWTLSAAKIAGVALSTTSLAVVYSVLVETGINKTELGKIIMAATFVTDFGTAAALSILFLQFNIYTLLFGIFSIFLLVFAPKIIAFFFKRYENRVIEPEIKLLFLIFFIAMFLGELGKSHAVLPIFLLGLFLSKFFTQNHQFIKKLRTVGFALITPFFFIKGGMSVGLHDVLANWKLVLILLAVKIVAKITGVYPTARSLLQRGGRVFLTLLMSTGLTFGTISSIYGYQAGYITKVQFSILISVVILSAVVPTIIAQRFFAPLSETEKEEILAEEEEG